MASKYSFQSEKEAIKADMLELLEEYADDSVEFYLANGFDALAISLKLNEDWKRRVLFDFLMIEKKAILECIRRNKGFFLKMISEGKGNLIRPMLGMEDEKYDEVWVEALDLLNLYFVQRKVDEKLFNLSLENFFENSMLNEQENSDE